MQTAEYILDPKLAAKKFILTLLDLAKVRITFFVSVSTFIGFVMSAGKISVDIFVPTLGVFLLASGSSALNHFQERDIDKLMLRTKSRPIPAGDVSPLFVLTYALLLAATGLLILFVFVNVTAALLGFTALVWYNVIYTPMKMKTALAVVPGSVIGALPPMIGWASAGGDITDPQIISLALFFFIWQIPHFWLLLLIHSKDYESAGFPTLTQMFSKKQLARITFTWITSLAVSGVIIPFTNLNVNLVTVLLLLVFGTYIVIMSTHLLKDLHERVLYRNAFMRINVYVLLVVFILSIDKLLLSVF